MEEKEEFQIATAATVRALGIAPTHEIHFGRLWQSGPEQTEFPSIADDHLLRGLADTQAAALRYTHDYGVLPFDNSAQKEFFAFLEQTRQAACLARHFVGSKTNFKNLWAEENVIDFKTLGEHDPGNDELNTLLQAARQDWLDDHVTCAVPALTNIFFAQLKLHLNEPAAFLNAAKQMIEMVWQQHKPMETPSSPQEMPKSTSTYDAPEEARDDTSPLAAKSEEESEAPSANGSGEAQETELKSDTAPSEEGQNAAFTPEAELQASALSRYHVFNSHFDEIIHASQLLTTKEQQKLRSDLETQLQPFQRLVNKLAQQLQQQLQSWEPSGWQRGLDDGLLDLQRLPNIYTHHRGAHLIYKQPHMALAKDCVVTLLLDNSGSMRGRPILITAMCADILAHTLERCGVKVEILGYTTKAWKGGAPYKEWKDNGMAKNPGRLNELRHIIYKSADQNWRQSRLAISAMLKEGLLKENIDGEALLWAHQRLIKRREKRKILMVISDGAPVDDATLAANSPEYLEQHLHDTIAWIEHQKKAELVAIGIGHDVTRYYPRATVIANVETLAETMLGQLSKLLKR